MSRAQQWRFEGHENSVTPTSDTQVSMFRLPPAFHSATQFPIEAFDSQPCLFSGVHLILYFGLIGQLPIATPNLQPTPAQFRTHAAQHRRLLCPSDGRQGGQLKVQYSALKDSLRGSKTPGTQSPTTRALDFSIGRVSIPTDCPSVEGRKERTQGRRQDLGPIAPPT